MSRGTLVIRLSSMGDVVLAGAVTAAIGPVSFLTRAAWAPLVARLAGVGAVLVWEEIQAGRQALPRDWDRVIDLHRSPRTRRLRLGGARAAVERYDLRRRLRVWAKRGDPPPPVIARYAAAAGVAPAPRPWIAGWRGGELLALAPGAAHATKRWAPSRWAALARTWAGPVAVLGGPGDEELVAAVTAAAGPRATAVVERGFERTLATLAQARAVVAGDTGLMHLAGAMGAPVVGIYGPTTSADGFWDPAIGRVVEVDLPCRPCSLHGGARCPMGDHLCMAGLQVEQVAAALAALLAAPVPAGGAA